MPTIYCGTLPPLPIECEDTIEYIKINGVMRQMISTFVNNSDWVGWVLRQQLPAKQDLINDNRVYSPKWGFAIGRWVNNDFLFCDVEQDDPRRNDYDEEIIYFGKKYITERTEEGDEEDEVLIYDNDDYRYLGELINGVIVFEIVDIPNVYHEFDGRPGEEEPTSVLDFDARWLA